MSEVSTTYNRRMSSNQGFISKVLGSTNFNTPQTF